MVVTVCGHSSLTQERAVRAWLIGEMEQLIAEGADIFYLGGYGAFDRLAASVVRHLKERHPHIQGVLVLPYLDRAMPYGDYDQTVYPPLETVPKRFAISHRNRWMVSRADVVLAYVLHSFGGAAATLRDTQGKGKGIIAFPPPKKG